MGQKQSYNISEDQQAAAALEKEGCIATNADWNCKAERMTHISSKTDDSCTATTPVQQLDITKQPDDIPIEHSQDEKSHEEE
ncbi:unnamed protein product [Anisakis simplex]|uniref:Uncharacterized protein n=1 Tax=Anisakis simplex TaxID=6269 RepID=A0A0M3JTC1_ANISI|nr:unnamed protein product [Anisakis simplex]